MAFNHRKLISDSGNTSILDVCVKFCDPIRNTEGYCPIPCISLCYPTCYRRIPYVISPPDPTTAASDGDPHKTQKLHLSLIISLSILAVASLVFCCYTAYKFYKNWDSSRRRSSQPQLEETHDEFLDEDRGPVLDHPIWYIRTIGLQPSVINSITVCKYKRGDGLVEGTECSVCLNEFQEDETLRLLPKCNHAFHIPCIDTWLRSHTNCPMCRAGIFTNTAALPLPTPVPEQNFGNPVVRDEAQEVIPESGGEFMREREDGDHELRMGTQEEGETQVETVARSPETLKEEAVDCDHLGVDEVQPMRRSVSMDSVSASMISLAIANAHPVEFAGNSGAQLAKVKESKMGIVSKKVDINQSLLRLVGSSSIGRSLQKGPMSIKRSLSCSGKVLSSRYSRSRRNSLLPS